MISEEMNCEPVWVGIGINMSPADSEYETINRVNGILKDQYGSSIVFDPTTNQPHINLFDVDIPKDNLKKVEVELEEIAGHFSSFSINLQKVDYFKYGILFIGCEINESLKKIEKNIVETISPLRGQCKTEEYWQPWREYSDREKENRKKYGNPHVLDTFTPHMTIGFVKKSQEDLIEIAEQLNKELTIKQIECSHIDLVVHDKQGKQIYSRRFLLKQWEASPGTCRSCTCRAES